MSATISPGTGQRYGMRRVCRVWGVPRATVYLRRQDRPEPQRRGPKPLIPDAELLPMIREDLATFMDLYNRAWRLEKMGGRTPDEARQAWVTKQAA